jgi:hypothetical protein
MEAAFWPTFAADVKPGLKALQPGLSAIHQPVEYVLQNLPKGYTHIDYSKNYRPGQFQMR